MRDELTELQNLMLTKADKADQTELQNLLVIKADKADPPRVEREFQARHDSMVALVDTLQQDNCLGQYTMDPDSPVTWAARFLRTGDAYIRNFLDATPAEGTPEWHDETREKGNTTDSPIVSAFYLSPIDDPEARS